MKIALVVPGGVDSSAERRVVPALLALIRRLAQRHELHVFALRQQATPAGWPLLGAQVHNIGTGRLALLRCLLAIRAEHRRGRFDLVHSIWSGSCGLRAVLAARWLGLPALIHLAGGELTALPDIAYGGALRPLGRWRERRVLRAADGLSAASAPMLQQLSALGLTAERIPLGVDREHWPSQAPRRRSHGQPLRLIHVASLNPVKDQTLLLQSVAELQASGLAFRLDIVGEDRLEGRIQQLGRQLGLADHLHFHGFMTQSQLHPLLAAADLLLVSSRHEAGPLVLLEAGLVGVPGVGTAVGHLREWAPGAALAVEVGDARALAAAVLRLAGDEDLRLRLANEALCRARREDADWTAAAFERLYGQVLEAHRS
ncbi:glycosyltransferase [Pelomonas sp. SE-A7]|uniref:glycosyltransferase n=1 Tax=Pelomonas sp. SE-A7 TaxID=3054953 RepID=UPI00259C7AA7|nr:glycosyltransferase [Pelomonas sp. SE-A7]MDM4765397.1 glycosyltransferase [Pelomonas sp. SE-A7]